jgi:hypothetical protein
LGVVVLVPEPVEFVAVVLELGLVVVLVVGLVVVLVDELDGVVEDEEDEEDDDEDERAAVLVELEQSFWARLVSVAAP